MSNTYANGGTIPSPTSEGVLRIRWPSGREATRRAACTLYSVAREESGLKARAWPYEQPTTERERSHLKSFGAFLKTSELARVLYYDKIYISQL